MSIQQEIFFIIGTLMIFYTSIQEYINLNKFSKKDLFKDTPIYNIDLLATRIYTLLHFTENAKFFLYPYMWIMIGLSFIGTVFFFENAFLFNILAFSLFGFFLMQYRKFLFPIAYHMEKEDIKYTYENIYNELTKEEWVVNYNNISLSKFTKETLDKFNLTSKRYGKIDFEEYFNLKEDKILSQYKSDEDLIFVDKEGNKYDVINYGGKKKIRRITIGISNLVSALNKEENISNKMLFSIIEATTSSFVLYLSIIGFNIKI